MYVEFTVEDHVATILLNRPEKLNAFNEPMSKEIWTAFHRAEDEEDVRAVVLCGAGRAFCAGADLVEMESPEAERGRTGPFWRPMDTGTLYGAWEMTKPVVVAIHGYCVAGGFELAAFADIRVCSEDAKIGCPAERFNVPDGQLAALLPQMVGASDAFLMLYTGDLIDGREAHRIGLASRLLPDRETAIREATAIAARIARNGPTSIQMTKYLAHRGRHSIQETMRLYHEYNRLALLSEDSVEGNRAFRERRDAQFRGR